MPHRILAVLCLGGTAATLVAQSNSSFELTRDTYATNSEYAGQIVTGDFNHDGMPDYIVATSQHDLVLRLGNGDGTFEAPKTIGTAANSISDMTVADLNNDGKLDVIVALNGQANTSGDTTVYGFQVFMGNGDGTFQSPLTYTTPYLPFTVTAGDFTGNGLEDIAVGDYHGEIEIWNNTGGGEFALNQEVKLTSETDAVTVRAGEFDGDGIVHLAATAGSGVQMAWNDGKENFTVQTVDSNDNAGFMSVGDVAQDGRDDILFAYAAPSSGNYSVDVVYGQGGEKTITKTVLAGVTNYLSTPLAVDVNGDGLADLVFNVNTGTIGSSNSRSGMWVFLQQANGTFESTPLGYYATTNDTGALGAADFNRDGMMDFVGSLGADEEMETFLNSGPRAACATGQTSPSVTVCEPVNNTYSNSPVRVEANSFDTTKVTGMQEYVDNNLEYSEGVSSFDTTFTESAGSHSFVTKGWDSSGRSFVSDRTVTVYSGTPGATCPVAEGEAAICLPGGSTSGSPVQIVANGWTPDVPTAAQLYIDGTLVVNNDPCNTEGNTCEGTSEVDTTQSLSSGSHDLVFKLWDNLGNVYTAQKAVTVQ